MENSDAIKTCLEATLKSQKNILFARPSIVYRGSYSGRDIIAKNSDPEKDVDERGYFPVERWILSKTIAENDKMKANEGLSILILQNLEVSFKDAVDVAEKALLGDFAQKWPLTKISDIGGRPVKPKFSNGEADEEVPPIPAHVHSGNVCNNKACGPGKKEAYFFPPLDVEPYKANLGKVITRLGLQPSITKDSFELGLKGFGENDEIYSLMNVFPINAYDGWTILPGVLHAPGPWLTFEIQRPQDDFNLASWRLGQSIADPNERESFKQAFQMKGLGNEKDFISELIEWDLTTSPKFKEQFYRPSTALEQGEWGRRIQIFFDGFYGEGFEVKAGHSFTRKADHRPYSGVVWSGSGKINDNHVNCTDDLRKEFIVVPNTETTFVADGNADLLIYVVFPLED